MIKLILQVNIILDFSKKEIEKQTRTTELEIYEDLDVMVRLIILDDVKDSLIPHLSQKKTTHEMLAFPHNLF